MKGLIAYQDKLPILTPRTETVLINLEKRIQKLKETQDKYKSAILDEMRKNNIYKLETDSILLSYIAPTTRETFDSKTLKQYHPDIYDAHINISEVKDSLRIKIK